MKFRKKPVEIEAVQFTWNVDEIIRFVGDDCIQEMDGLYIKTLEGSLHISRNDWVIKGVKGEFYPCKPDIFAATYESVD
jgi:hypothetical protein